MRWKHVAAASLIAVLAMLIIGILLWYVVLYLPMSQHLTENQNINERIQEMQQSHRLNTLPVNSSTTSTLR
ncbi:MAG: hypothetical protein WCF77_02245 [Minisyncoccia bacterium]